MFRVAYVSAALTAVCLAVGTRHIAPFAALVLAMVAVCEFTRAREMASIVRGVVVMSANLLVWILIFIYRIPAETRPEYPPLPAFIPVLAALLLFSLQAVAMWTQSIVRRQRISAFQAGEVLIAFTLLVCAILWLVPETGFAIVGLLCMALTATCYLVAFGPFGQQALARNFRIFVVWSSLLFVAALFILAPASVAASLLGLAGLVGIVLASRFRVPGMGLQGVVYLTTAGVISGMLPFAFRALAGQMPGAPSWPILLVVVSALLSCAAAAEVPSESPYRQSLHLIPAVLASVGGSALIIRALSGLLSSRITLDVFHIALLRTITLCLVSLLLAWICARFHRLQLRRIAYLVLIFVAAKLLFEDLPHGKMVFIAASIVVVALTLLGVPRLSRMRLG
jgi:hypothetical protein